MNTNPKSNRDIVIIGGGHNGLVTAFYLAKAGFKPLVLERRPQVGGAAITDEFHPGFRCSTLAHTAGPIRADIVRNMQLEKHGLRFITPENCVTALSPDGRALSLYQDESKSAQVIAAFSQNILRGVLVTNGTHRNPDDGRRAAHKRRKTLRRSRVDTKR